MVNDLVLVVLSLWMSWLVKLRFLYCANCGNKNYLTGPIAVGLPELMTHGYRKTKYVATIAPTRSNLSISFNIVVINRNSVFHSYHKFKAPLP